MGLVDYTRRHPIVATTTVGTLTYGLLKGASVVTYPEIALIAPGAAFLVSRLFLYSLRPGPMQNALATALECIALWATPEEFIHYAESKYGFSTPESFLVYPEVSAGIWALISLSRKSIRDILIGTGRKKPETLPEGYVKKPTLLGRVFRKKQK